MIVLLLCVVLISGCGGSSELRAPGSADEAQTILKRVLDAWALGESVDAAGAEEPRVIIVDEDWKAGRPLTKYELPGDGVENGGHWRIPVQISLSGRPPITAYYAVTPGNPASVIRSDFAY